MEDLRMTDINSRYVSVNVLLFVQLMMSGGVRRDRSHFFVLKTLFADAKTAIKSHPINIGVNSPVMSFKHTCAKRKCSPTNHHVPESRQMPALRGGL